MGKTFWKKVYVLLKTTWKILIKVIWKSTYPKSKYASQISKLFVLKNSDIFMISLYFFSEFVWFFKSILEKIIEKVPENNRKFYKIVENKNNKNKNNKIKIKYPKF